MENFIRNLGRLTIVLMLGLLVSKSAYSGSIERWFAAINNDESTAIQYSFDVEFSPKIRKFYHDNYTSPAYGGCDMDSSTEYETQCQLWVQFELGKVTIRSEQETLERSVFTAVIFRSEPKIHQGTFKCETYSDQQMEDLYRMQTQNGWEVPARSWTVYFNKSALHGKVSLFAEGSVLQVKKASLEEMVEDRTLPEGIGRFRVAPSASVALEESKQRWNDLHTYQDSY